MDTHLVGLSSSLGPGCQGLPWGQWAQAAPKGQLYLQGKECELGGSGVAFDPHPILVPQTAPAILRLLSIPPVLTSS